MTFIPADTTNYTKATASVALTVNQATPAIKLISSATSIVSGGSVRFTAAATGTGVTPAGNVMFFDGAKQLSSDPLSGGVAKFATTELAVGKHSITATYVGNGDYGSATSTAISVTVTAK